MTARTLSKEKIVAAAIELIKNQDNLTFTNLSRKLGIRSQAIYNYYPDIMAVKADVAAKFYDDLATRLKADLLGLQGKQAIKAFANVIVHYALSNFVLAQQIIGISSSKIDATNLNQSRSRVLDVLKTFLEPMTQDEKTRVVITQMLRVLVIGEILHVGNGQFDNKTISAQDSFDEMLDLALAKLEN